MVDWSLLGLDTLARSADTFERKIQFAECDMQERLAARTRESRARVSDDSDSSEAPEVFDTADLDFGYPSDCDKDFDKISVDDDDGDEENGEGDGGGELQRDDVDNCANSNRKCRKSIVLSRPPTRLDILKATGCSIEVGDEFITKGDVDLKVREFNELNGKIVSTATTTMTIKIWLNHVCRNYPNNTNMRRHQKTAVICPTF